MNLPGSDRRRLPAVVLALGLVVSGLVAAPPTAAAQTALQTKVEVSGNYVTIGDLFQGAPLDKADTPVAHAPEPGERMVLDTAWLAAISLKHGVGWKPATRFERATVTRASRYVAPEEIEGLVEDALRAEGLTGRLDIQLDGTVDGLHLPIGRSGQVRIAALDLERNSGRFTGTMEADLGGSVPMRESFGGRVFETISVPVAARRLSGNTEPISAADLDWQEMRADRIAPNIIMDADRIIGMAPKRSIGAGNPIKESDLQTAVVIPKGEVITILYRTRAMTLTAQGRAMEDGGAGETIRVQNIGTRRNVYARVASPDLVTVTVTPNMIGVGANN